MPHPINDSNLVTIRHILFFLTCLLFFTIVIPVMAQSHDGAVALSIYNQAYQENYDADSFSYILSHAHDGYVLIDPFNQGAGDQIPLIKRNNNQIACYMSVGTGESWRDDFALMRRFLVRKPWSEWQGEYYVNNIQAGILVIMKARLDKMATWGCDWVEFDNMDWAMDEEVRDEYRIQVTKEQAISYVQDLCDYARKHSMRCMAKNTLEGFSYFDGVTYESYSDDQNWWDEDDAMSFIQSGKLAIIIHYDEENCDDIYDEYQDIYGETVSFICENVDDTYRYRHYPPHH